MLGAYVFLLCAVIVLRLVNGFSGDEFTTILAIVVPMFSGYSTSIIAFIVKDRHTQEDKTLHVTPLYALLSLVFPATFLVAIFAGIFLQAYSLAFENFEEFKRFLLTVETAFAVYVGMFIYSMFERKKTKQT